MSILSLGTTPVSQPLSVGAATGTSSSSAQKAFSAQLQSLRAGQSSPRGTETQTAYQAQPNRGAASKAHHPRGRYASDTDSNAADGTASGLSTTGMQRGFGGAGFGASDTGATGGASQQAPGGALLDSMMRGLQAYGATSALA
jgi:hypothetical protein